MALTEGINIELLHSRIVQRLGEAFPDTALIKFDYNRLEKKIPTPCILLELTEFEPKDDMGTGQLHGVCRFEARCLVNSLKSQAAGADVRQMAIGLAGYIYKTRWGTRQPNALDPYAETETLPVGAAEIIGCFPDAFYPDLDEYEVWRVEWEQKVYIGDSAWIPTGQIPTAIYVNENVIPYPPAEQLPSIIYPPILPGPGNGGGSGNASRWHPGEGVPAPDLGKVGDLYLDVITGDIYDKTGDSTWILSGNIKGPQGDQGEQGPPGEDTGSGDKTYRVTFTDAESQVVEHNLGKYPSVVFKDSAGTEYEVSVNHDSLNQCTVTWNTPITGSITCN